MESNNPHRAEESELSVLSSCLRSLDDAVFFSSELDPECFLHPRDKALFAAIAKTMEEDGKMDVVAVFHRLAGANKPDSCKFSYIAEVMENPIAVNREIHVKTLLEKKAAREALKISQEAVAKFQNCNGDFEAVLSGVKESILGIEVCGEGKRRESVSVQKLLEDQMKRLEALERHGTTPGIKTGFYDLDALTDGFQRSDLVIVAGRPSMGKTSFATDCARAMSKQSPGLIFSLEMSAEQLIDRIVAPVAKVDLRKFRTGDFDADERKRVTDAQGYVFDLPIHIDDDPAADIGKIHLKLLKNVYKHKIRWAVIDYIQLIDGAGRNREEEVGKISRRLKQYAKEFDMPIIALSQLNRKCEDRTDKKPLLSDLRESGAIEQDADVIMFVWRGEHYWPNNNEIKGLAELLIRKHRNGPTGDIRLRWEGRYSSFQNFAVESKSYGGN